jgi:hypothetical protein
MHRKRIALRLLGTALAASLATVALPGCGVITLIVQAAKKRSTNMDHWEVKSLKLGLRAESMCPRGSVQLAIFADAQHKKRHKRTKRLETWIDAGEGSNRMGKMGFEEFVFTSTNGTLDPANGRFEPNPDMLATVEGFAFSAKYKRDPKLEPASERFAPNYGCFTEAGSPGEHGDTGEPGEEGDDGRNGDGGGDEAPGSSGSNGGPAGNAGNGGDGGNGPNIVAYATVVKTPLFDHLVLVKITGDVEDMVLLDPKGPITVSARGGDGGAGGRGGEGGEGGDGGGGNSAGNGATGGPGGVGGVGGRGGAGGSVRLIYDPAFPELASAITVDAAGGAAGAAGAPGPGGDKGRGGNGMGSGGKSGEAGEDGPDGAGGSEGTPGTDGSASAEAGDVSAAFASLPPNVQRIAG